MVWILGGSSGLGLELAGVAENRGVNTLILGRHRANIGIDLSDTLEVEEYCNHLYVCNPIVIKNMDCFIWNASVMDYGSADSVDPMRMLEINITNPTSILRALVARKKELKSCLHLVTISSVASWKARAYMAVYAATKSYQAQLSRCLALELERDLPGSKVTVVMPAGMNTGIFKGSGVDASKFMDPKKVAEIIWDNVLGQKSVYDEFNILRKEEKPVLSRKRFAPGLAHDELPRYNPPRS